MARKTVMLELDKPRRMSMGLAEMGEIEDYFDKGLTEIFSKRLGVKVLLVTLWVCARQDDKSLTLEKMTSVVDDAVESGQVTLEDIGAKVNELVESSGLFAKKATNAETA